MKFSFCYADHGFASRFGTSARWKVDGKVDGLVDPVLLGRTLRPEATGAANAAVDMAGCVRLSGFS